MHKNEIETRMNLFNENEAEVESESGTDAFEPIAKDVNGYGHKYSRTKREETLKDIPVCEVLCEIPGNNSPVSNAVLG